MAQRRVAGIDEAGRGPLAGPVVAAACVLDDPSLFSSFSTLDSKQLKEKNREFIYDLITNSSDWAVSVVEREEIDALNILEATMVAMRRSALALKKGADFFLIDGNRAPEGLPSPYQTLIGGDGIDVSIGCASIIAKVWRDRLMMQYHEMWPEYGFAKHKGYGTKEHLAALERFGPCPIHRRSFAPLKLKGEH